MIEPTTFAPLSAALGGILIGLAATLLMWGLGRIAGISGIVRTVLRNEPGERAWRWAFLAGMVASAYLVFHFTGARFEIREGFPLLKLVLGGLLVGYGTALGSGCTSGHGVCGIARFSARSLVATAVFMALGVVTAIVVRHGLGGMA